MSRPGLIPGGPSGRAYWPTAQGMAASGREPVVHIDPVVKDIQLVLVTGRQFAAACRGIGAPDETLEGALDRIGRLVAEAVDYSRPYGDAA